MEKGNAIEQAVTKQVAGVVKDELETVQRAIKAFDSLLSAGLYDVGIELAKRAQVAMGYSVEALAHLKDNAYTESIQATNNLLSEISEITRLMSETPNPIEEPKGEKPRVRPRMSAEERRERRLARQREYNKRYAARKRAEKEASQNE